MGTIIDFPQAGTIGASLKPKRFDIEIYQGDTFGFDLEFNDELGSPIVITGWTGSASIKKVSDNTAGETPSLSVAVTDGPNGIARISLTDTETSALDGDTEYKYDIQFSDGTNKRTFIGGKITVTEDITEP